MCQSMFDRLLALFMAVILLMALISAGFSVFSIRGAMVNSRMEGLLVQARAKVGNLYVNRNQIGAVVGSQPFGGEGLSGTGPKAGGPHYVARFATERVTCIDTTAAGGNASLMAGADAQGHSQPA